ncbi:hypothetical protein NGB36_08985 [Streptomyces sp. RB6PN25]|uniref:Uncharacterized protein n=2 Tax=Streptomyces humicola TaxID=2953240 RepID=A0ABT1PSS9_9ACTN|nr:hypothetical protein [Streptomyces humicola]
MVTRQLPSIPMATAAARSAISGSSMRIRTVAPRPISTRPTPSRCTAPASGPPTTLISTAPVGSPPRQPAGSWRLTTAPSRSGESVTVRDGSTANPST